MPKKVPQTILSKVRTVSKNADVESSSRLEAVTAPRAVTHPVTGHVGINYERRCSACLKK
jgi:hypothetical protein